MEVTKDMLITDVIKLSRDTVPVFQGFGMGCVGCMAARGESVEQAAGVHGINLDELLDKLNEVI